MTAGRPRKEQERPYSVRFEVPAVVRARSRDEANAEKDRIADRVQRRVRTLRGFRSAVVEAGPAEEMDEAPSPKTRRAHKSTVTLGTAVDLLKRWRRHHDRAITGNPCDSFNACNDIDTETDALLREYRTQTRSAPRPSKRRRSGGRVGGA